MHSLNFRAACIVPGSLLYKILLKTHELYRVILVIFVMSIVSRFKESNIEIVLLVRLSISLKSHGLLLTISRFEHFIYYL